ncbi:MAG: hypothetical protein JSV86_05470 [Gemmatimonadota bacterium]|nr:MAG: hypothetical protein JSV86_05470 [Gemmatimonadota bacterium]
MPDRFWARGGPSYADPRWRAGVIDEITELVADAVGDPDSYSSLCVEVYTVDEGGFQVAPASGRLPGVLEVHIKTYDEEDGCGRYPVMQLRITIEDLATVRGY